MNGVPLDGLESLIGTEVQIWPSDTYQKRGILVQVLPYACVFKITYSEDKKFYVGDTLVVSWSANLAFESI